MFEHLENRPVTIKSVLQSIQEVEPWAKKLDAVMAPDEFMVTSFLNNAINIYHLLEEETSHPQALIDTTEAERIKAIWIISAPGTYFSRDKNDRYRDKPFSYWNDRRRINYAFRLGRQIAQLRSGQSITTNTPADLALLREFGPSLVYNGRTDENDALSDALYVPWLRIPEGLAYPSDRVSIIYPHHNPRFNNKDYNLLDQIRTFHLPYNLEIKLYDEIGIVAHAPQLVRTLYSLARYPHSLPKDALVKAFPLPTPEEGMPEYPIQELRGIVYYGLIAKPPLVGPKHYPFLY